MRALSILLLALGITPFAQAGALEPVGLRCEARPNPLGIDESAPLLSWRDQATRRAEHQTAYRILVASSPQNLDADKGDLWDSGQVESDRTHGIPYSGKPLSSHQFAYWKVQVRDRDGQPSSWSQPAFWSMGLLSESDWKAQWIGFDKSRQVELPEAPFEDAQWIWFAPDAAPAIPRGIRVFAAELDVPENAKIASASLLVAADDRYSFNINGNMAATDLPGLNSTQRARRVDVTPFVHPGKNTLRVQVENASDGPAGLIARLSVQTADDHSFVKNTDASWHSTNAPGANWHKRPLNLDDWPASRILGPHGIAPWGKLAYSDLVLPPPPYLRTEFQAEKTVKQAVLYASALGNIDLYLNGHRVSNDYFTPGWTDYNKRVYYRAYDVTPLMKSGPNALGAILADGWYSGYIGWGHIRDHYGKSPRALVQLHLVHDDGSTSEIASSSDWRASSGAIKAADFLMGETHDARLEPSGWSEAGFDASKWAPVDTGAEVHPKVQAHPGPPVVAIHEFKPVEITEPRPGVYILNLGRNFAGFARLKFDAEPGQEITLRFAERLNPDGSLYVTNLRGAVATDHYIAAGNPSETWQPRFTFHGFQYVEVSGLTRKPDPDTVVGVAISSDTPVSGSFESSDPMLNQLHSNIYWTQRANFIDIPTDCPQRDERLGWTGDAQVYIRAATLNTDVQAFFTKWLRDLEDGQRPDGQFPMVAPVKVAGNDGGPAWADAGVICPWTTYYVYGDRRLLKRHYDSMTRFIDFCQKRSTPDLLPPKQYHAFGDWLSIKADTPKDVIYMAYFANSTRLTARAAEALGKTDDARKYHALYNRIKAAFNKAHVQDDGRITGDTQAVYVLALANDLLDGDRAKQAADHLVDDIRARDWHLSTGFIGTKDLMLVLARIGRDDVAYRLLFNDTFPSWGFSIKQGATSIWERWDGWTPEKGFQDPGMNSFAHYSFGAVYQWMVENLGGIQSTAPAYKSILIAPVLSDRLTHARTTYNCIHGEIVSDWTVKNGRLTLTVTIPPNTTAAVHVPSAQPSDVTESGHPLAQSDGVLNIRQEANHTAFTIGSGTYQFVSTSPTLVKTPE